MKQTVFVGLSGGVDSAVSAALLKEATPNNFEKLFGRPTPSGFRGYDVVGAFIKIGVPEFLECTWREDRLDAIRTCTALQIPFREIDLSREYREEVVRDMIDTYQRGETPNPDVLCNRIIKFGAFARWAFAQGADMIATGHYARAVNTSLTCVKHKSDLCLCKVTYGGVFSLLRGKDSTKDQSYFLYRLGQNDLSRTLFPIGGYEKHEVRALAKKLDLPVAKKPDSQGLCFVGDISLPEFLSHFIPLERGTVLDAQGNTIGEHDGAALYTRGQRHGIHAPQGPHFVTRVDMATNTVVVSSHTEDATSHEAFVRDTHWIEGEPSFPLSVHAMPRYRAPLAEVEITQAANVLRACFKKPQIISPGQSLVFYEGERCLGGGVIAA